MAQDTFSREGYDVCFKGFDEDASYLPVHAPDTFLYILQWMYQGEFGIAVYYEIRFGGCDKRKESMKVAFLLLSRVYLLADYLDIEELSEFVMVDFGQTLVPNKGRELLTDET